MRVNGRAFLMCLQRLSNGLNAEATPNKYNINRHQLLYMIYRKYRRTRILGYLLKIKAVLDACFSQSNL